MLNIKKDFPWFKKNSEIIYLDSAATTLKPQVVVDAINDYVINQSTNSHNTDSSFTYQAHEIVQQSRNISAKLIEADPEEIIFTSGATESLNLIAHALQDIVQANDEIVLTYFEHGSNLLPWYRLSEEKHAKIIFAQHHGLTLLPEDFVKCLTPKTKIVSFIGCSNVLGNCLPIKEITKAIKQYNPKIFVCVDLAQMVPHHACHVHTWGVDFAAYSGHKIFADTGIGICYIKARHQAILKPLKYGGGMNTLLNTKEFSFADGVAKFEGGTPNISGIYSILKASEFLMGIGYLAISEHQKETYALLLQGLKDCPHLEIYNWEAHSGILAFNVKGVFSQDTASYLGKHNFIVRSGLSCAKLVNNVIDQELVVRASFYVYNTKADVEQFIECLRSITKEKIFHELV